jgi:hypothetical protein
MKPEQVQLNVGVVGGTAAPKHIGLLLNFSCVGSLSGEKGPAEWRKQVDEAWWYQISCFMYTIAGLVMLLRPEPLERALSIYPWRMLGVTVTINGITSFQADVVSWGHPSCWKTFDVFLASTNMLQSLAIFLLCLSGLGSMPAPTVAFLGAGLFIALVCKARASAAMRRKTCWAYLRWHSGWHYSLPSCAIVGMLLMHESCDYTQAGCSCPMPDNATSSFSR